MKTPIPYVADFLTKEEADTLFAFCQTLPHERLRNPRRQTCFYRRVKYPSYIYPFTDTPSEIKTLADKISKFAGKTIYHLGVDAFNFHQHKKDHGVKNGDRQRT